jgi:3-methyladenine DNA glycosylase AlkC
VASALKRFFDAQVVTRIARSIAAVEPGFGWRAFVHDALAGLERLELMDRGRHIGAALRTHLPADPERAIEVLTRSLGPPLKATEGHGMEPFFYLPHVLFVAEHGLGCFEASLTAQHALTQRFSAEFSIRRFLEHEPERTLARLRAWTRDPSPHVRRLVSEGTRPRLPWAGRLSAFQRDPTPVLELLERLKDDPHPYVRRSVANNLNDIGKDHPVLLVEVARRWLDGAGPERRRLVEHALRSAVKRGDTAALAALGYGGSKALRVRSVGVKPARPRIGEQVAIVAELENAGAEALPVAVDLRVHFVKARGTTAPKVFKLRALTLAPGERVLLRKRISLAQHTTRTHHPGRHALELLLNGRPHPAGAFDVRLSPVPPSPARVSEAPAPRPPDVGAPARETSEKRAGLGTRTGSRARRRAR